MEVSWDDWRLIAAAWKAGSFTAAAESLGIGQATVSRRVASVEEAVGHALFDRHRTGLVPTPAMRALRAELEGFVAAAGALEHALTGHEVRAEGVVRLTLPPGLAAGIGPQLALRLAQTHPDITLELLAIIDPLDLDRREADIALRTLPTSSGDLVSKRLATLPGGLFAAPSLLAQLPDPVALADVPLVGWAAPHDETLMARALRDMGGPIRLTTNDYLVLRELVIAGVGATLLSWAEANQFGLEPVPVSLDLPMDVPIYRVVHRALRHVPRVAAVIDAIDDVASDPTFTARR